MSHWPEALLCASLVRTTSPQGDPSHHTTPIDPRPGKVATKCTLLCCCNTLLQHGCESMHGCTYASSRQLLVLLHSARRACVCVYAANSTHHGHGRGAIKVGVWPWQVCITAALHTIDCARVYRVCRVSCVSMCTPALSAASTRLLDNALENMSQLIATASDLSLPLLMGTYSAPSCF